MKNLSAKVSKLIFVGLLLLLGLTSPLSAQSSGTSRDSIASFVQSVGRTVYNLAWPTATYREISLKAITSVETGFDVSVRISGQSAFDDSDLWVQLVIEIRNGSIHDLRVQAHNAIIAPPFATSHALATAAVDMAKAYAAKQTQPTAPAVLTPTPAESGTSTRRAAAVCLANTVNADLSFDYKWGDGAWQQAKVSSGNQIALWWPYGGGPHTSPQLSIRYDDSFAEGYTERDYDLNRTQAALPVSCDSATNYKFAMSGSTILLYATAAQ